MSNKYTYHSLIQESMRLASRPMTADEVWAHAVRSNLVAKLRNPPGKTPAATVASHIYSSLKEGGGSPYIKLGQRPVRFYLREIAGQVSATKLQEQAARPEEPRTIGKIRERDIHPAVVFFASERMNVHCRTIYHESSNKSKKSEWLHPDLVGLHLPVDSWEPQTLELSRELGASIARLFAFEVKLQVDFSNLRESFFQTVSNSSWAHEGYLVAGSLSSDDEFAVELKRLSDSFGIGVICLDLAEPDNAQLIHRSRHRDLDWETINKLASLNRDYATYMKSVQNALKIHRIDRGDFDEVPKSANDLVAQLRTRMSK